MWGEIPDLNNHSYLVSCDNTEEPECLPRSDQRADDRPELSIQCEDEADKEQKKNCLKENLLTRITKSNGFFKHQQKDEPELSYQEKYEIVKQLLEQKPANFLTRFSQFLDFCDLPIFDMHRGDYMVDIQCKQLIKRLHDTKGITVRNRRFSAMKKLMKDGEYFSDSEMKQRNPLLYEEMIGKHLSEDCSNLTDKSDLKFSSILFKHMDIQNEKLLKEAQREQLREEEEESDDSSSDLSSCDDNTTSTEAPYLRKTFLKIMQNNFVNGKEEAFDYTKVDYSQEYDDLEIEGKDAEEKYFDEEESCDEQNEERIQCNKRRSR